MIKNAYAYILAFANFLQILGLADRLGGIIPSYEVPLKNKIVYLTKRHVRIILLVNLG